MNKMKHLYKLLATTVFAAASILPSQAADTQVMRRPFSEFAKTAFCAYGQFHPSEYIIDNNWDILCAFRQSGEISRLDTLGISHNESQLMLLQAGGLLERTHGKAHTLMPILDEEQTHQLRQRSAQFADSIYLSIKPSIKRFAELLSDAGYSAQTYSLVFSFLLDGAVWDKGKLPMPTEMERAADWSGVYWALYTKRAEATTGTNGYGPLQMNWTADMKCRPDNDIMLAVGKELYSHPDALTLSNDLAVRASAYGICDADGKLTVPVLYVDQDNEINRLTDTLSSQISDAIKTQSSEIRSLFSLADDKEAAVIYYHEIMWDILALLERDGVISKPAILTGDDTDISHLGQVMFIVATHN